MKAAHFKDPMNYVGMTLKSLPRRLAMQLQHGDAETQMENDHRTTLTRKKNKYRIRKCSCTLPQTPTDCNL